MSESTLRQRAAAPKFIEKPSKNTPSDIRPAVASSTIAKLLIATLALITLPLGFYFGSINTLFNGNATYAGAGAAVVTNIVLVAYLVAAFWEDQGDQAELAKQTEKKSE